MSKNVQELVDETLRAESVLMIQSDEVKFRIKKYAGNDNLDAFIIYTQRILKREGVDYCHINWYDFKKSVIDLL